MNFFPDRQNSCAGIRSILSNCLPESYSTEETLLERLTYHWNLVVGREIAAVATVEKISGKTLYVRVSGREWVRVLEDMKRKIFQEINRQPGFGNLTRIVFREEATPKAVKTVSPTAKRKQDPIDNRQVPKEVEGSLDMIKDQELKEILTRLSGKIRWMPLALAVLMTISNCTTLTVNQEVTPSPVDLASSYAVRDVQNDQASERTIKKSRDPRAYYHYLMALKAEQENLFEKAAGHYGEVVRHDPDSQENHEMMAGYLLRSGQIDEAYQVCIDALTRFPNNLTLNMILADIISSRGDFERALTYYQKVIQLKPHSIRGHLFAGLMHDRLGHREDTERMF
jgi:Tfp pilus assembly protein PilF